MKYINVEGKKAMYTGAPRNTRGDYGNQLTSGVAYDGDVYYWDTAYGWMSENLSDDWQVTSEKAVAEGPAF